MTDKLEQKGVNKMTNKKKAIDRCRRNVEFYNRNVNNPMYKDNKESFKKLARTWKKRLKKYQEKN